MGDQYDAWLEERKANALDMIAEQLRIANLIAVAHAGYGNPDITVQKGHIQAWSELFARVPEPDSAGVVNWPLSPHIARSLGLSLADSTEEGK